MDRASDQIERWVLRIALGGGLAGGALGGLAGGALAGPLAAAAAALGAAALAGLALRLALRRRLGAWGRILDALAQLAAGEAPVRLDPDALGDERALAAGLNALADRDRETQARLGALRVRMRDLGERFASGLAQIEQAGEAQEEAVEETASLMADINASMQRIDAEVASLAHVTDEASSSILEMGTSIDEVARSAGALHESVESSTASVHQISASIRQVAESADAVEGMAEETAASMTQMDRAIQEVSDHVRQASVLTERVSQEAEDGSLAVSATIDDIERIRSLAGDARDVLEKLAGRIAEIGEILTVIGGINEETNLLSLNAAIIAAQAGEQGKAFAVVANHVKTLAQRTASSTQEIERLIRAVQEESRNAVQAMGSGMQAVEAGVERSRRAGEALGTIRSSAHEASSRVSEIARAATEQTRNSTHVAEAAQRTSEMVQQISAAMAEQRRAGETLLRNAEAGLELCRQVHRATDEQRQSSRFVREHIGSITEMIRAFQENAASHARASEAVSATAARILEVARKIDEGLPGLHESVDLLGREAVALEGIGPEDAEPLEARLAQPPSPSSATARPAR